MWMVLIDIQDMRSLSKRQEAMLKNLNKYTDKIYCYKEENKNRIINSVSKMQKYPF